MGGAGIRWGLHAAQRAQLGLAECGEQNSAWFGLQRMLLAYAADRSMMRPRPAPVGRASSLHRSGRLGCGTGGQPGHLLGALQEWWQRSQQQATPEQWPRTPNGCCKRFLCVPTNWIPRRWRAARWFGTLAACLRTGRLCASRALAALRHGWMEALQEPRLDQRFRAGGVTFCTLMPMRAIPFEVVCLLGMNDGDYPRRAPRSDFDLMNQRGMFRPGDRSRQHDDRQLMLEALLSARRVLYVSWTGRSVRDNSAQPPSVLVAQLRDYIAAAWGSEAVSSRTTEHPLQPFSRRYFEAAQPLRTYAREWRGVHSVQEAPTAEQGAAAFPTLQEDQAPLDMERLVRFLRNPVKAFFKDGWAWLSGAPKKSRATPKPSALTGWRTTSSSRRKPSTGPHHPVRCSAAAGAGGAQARCPAARRRFAHGRFGRAEKSRTARRPDRHGGAWAAVGEEFAQAAPRIAVEHSHQGVLLRDWVDGVYRNDEGARTWVQLLPSKLLTGGKTPQPRLDKLLDPWLRTLLTTAIGQPVQGRVVGQDGVLHIQPMPQEQAQESLHTLCALWQQGQQAPLPLPLRTALALLDSHHAPDWAKAEAAYEGSDYDDPLAEVHELCWRAPLPTLPRCAQPARPMAPGWPRWHRRCMGRCCNGPARA